MITPAVYQFFGALQWCGSDWVRKVYGMRSHLPRMSSSLLSKTQFVLDRSIAIKFFSAKTPKDLPEYFVCLAINWNIVYGWNSPKIVFAIIRLAKSLPSVHPSRRWSFSSSEQLPIHLCAGCTFLYFSELGRYPICKRLSCILVYQDLPVYWIGPPSRPTRLRSVLVFEDVNCRLPGCDQSIVLHPFWHERPTLFGTRQTKLCTV